MLISTQHDPDVDYETLRQGVIDEIIMPVLPAELVDDELKIYVNPTGRFVIGGPMGDAGVTGRKIIVDTYGGMGRHGGGAFSGKDPTKVDRSAAYAARWVAKNIVAAGLAERCEVQLAYAIGIAQPLSISVETFGTGKLPADALVQLIERIRPAPRRHYPRPGPAPADLPPDGGLRSLRAHRPRPALGSGRTAPTYLQERRRRSSARRAVK